MYPLDERPTPEFYDQYKAKLAELNELLKHQGLSLEIKPGGRCFVVDRTRKDAPEPEKSHLIAYAEQFNKDTTLPDKDESDKEDYYGYDEQQFFEVVISQIHDAKDNDVVIDLYPDYIDLAPVEEEKLLHKEEAQLYAQFCFEATNIRNEGIRLNKLLYWDRKLVDHVGQPCIIRYDYSDARWIVVYDKNDTFICQAALRQTQHPFIEVSMDKAVSHKALNKEYNEIKKLRRDKERSAQKWVMSAQESVDALLRQHAKRPAVTDELEDAESLFNSPPMLEAPPPDPDEIIEEMTRQAMRNMPLHPSMLDNRATTENQDDETEDETPYEAKRRKDEEIRTVLERMGFDRREFRGEIPQFFIDMANNHIRKQQKEHNKAQTDNQTKPDKATSEQNKQPDHDDTDKRQHTLDEIDIELMRSEGIPIPGEDDCDEDESTQEPIEYLDKETLRRIGIFK